MKLRTSISLIALATLLAMPISSSTVFAAADATPMAAPAAPSISVITAEKRALQETLIVTGNITAREEVLVTPQVDGLTITEFLAEEGDTVKKGQVLVRLDGRLTDIQLIQNDATLARNDAAIAQAQSQITQSQIVVERTLRDWNRTKQLVASNVVSSQAADTNKAAYDTAVAQLETAKLGLESTKADKVSTQALREELMLRKVRTEILAPVSGLISSRQLQIGSVAAASKPALYTIVEDGEVKLVADIAEADLPKIQLGQKVKVEIGGMAEPVAGEVRLISPQVDTTSRLGKVHIAIAKDKPIPTGVFARGTIEIASSAGLTLPLTAVSFAADGNTIQVVKDSKVEVRKVKTGLVSAGHVEILEGLSAGEEVVAKAGTFVRDGDAVTPVELSSVNQ